MRAICLLFLVLAGQSLVAQGGDILYYLDVFRFHPTSSNVPQAEIFVAVDGTTISYKQTEADSLWRPSVKVELLIRRFVGDDTLPVHIDKYNLSLPDNIGLPDTSIESKRKMLLNAHRLGFEPGRYHIQLKVSDNYSESIKKGLASQVIELNPLEKGAFAFSDIKWIAERDPNKRGLAGIVPLVTNSTFINEDTISFYQELYNVDKILKDNFIIRSVLYQQKNRLWTTETAGQARPPRAKNVFFEEIDISKLRSNSYLLQVEILDKNLREIKTFREKFYVYNSRLDADFTSAVAGNSETDIFNKYTERELDEFIKTLRYRSTQQEIDFARALESVDQKKNFLYSFLAKRKSSPEQEVEALWAGHLAALNYVNDQFKSSIRPGWQTDRGRVFLQYGIPNDVERFPAESYSVPYEIWRFNRLGAQSNVVFVFFDPDLATSDYPLLHSNKYGELNQPRWRTMLQNNGRVPTEVDYENNDGRINEKLDLNSSSGGG